MESPDPPAGGASSSGPDDLELLRIEIGTIWKVDGYGRVAGPEVVLASSAVGLGVVFGPAVPDELAAGLTEAVAGEAPPADLRSPPRVLGECREQLERLFAPTPLTLACGPSYLVPDSLGLPGSVAVPDSVGLWGEVRLVRSDARDLSGVLDANPGNWQPAEWRDLIDGRLGPWAMVTDAGQVVSICHTPASTPRGAEAGTWTAPTHRGRGYAAATTAAWAALMRPRGRYLFYSTSDGNTSSQRVAARLSLRPIGWLWQLHRRLGPILQQP